MIYLTQLIFIKDGKEDVFHEFEDVAIPLMLEHGGKLMYRIRPTPENFITSEDRLPYEIHFISFESDQQLKNFMNDPKRLRFIALKNESIDSTILTKGLLI